jgi:hypothetical protein
MRNTQEQTAYILQLKRARETTRSRKRRRTVMMAAAACLILLLGVGSWLSGLVSWPFGTDDVPQASEIALLSVDGLFYSPIGNLSALFQADMTDLTITPGQMIGQVERQIGQDNFRNDSVRIYANVLARGVTIYEWSGYPVSFRVCARDGQGQLIGFERSYMNGSLPERRPVSDRFDFTGQVREILICNNTPREIGRITDPGVIEALMADFVAQAYFTGPSAADPVFASEAFYRLYLRLTDNSVTQLIVHQTNGFGFWHETVQLPVGFIDKIAPYVLGSLSNEEQNYGNLSADTDWGLLLLPEAANLSDPDLYEPTAAWVDGASGHLYLGDAKRWSVLLANDAQGDVRIEGQHIYYLTQTGQVARVKFAYPNSGTSIYEAAQSGTDLTGYVQTRDILAPGPYTRLQVRLGVFWTLDQSGDLRRNDTLIARQVSSFALDALGCSYSDKTAIWRWQNGTARKLADMNARSMTTIDVTLYFAPASGGVWRMRLDGSDLRQIYDLNVQKIVCQDQVLALLEQDSGRIYLTCRDQALQGTPYHASDVDLSLYRGLVFIDAETGILSQVRYQLDWDGRQYQLTLE